MPERKIRVVAALIEKDGRYLITQRRPQATLPLKWEFPGGRADEDESDAEALLRELEERMEIEVRVGERILQVDHEYPDYTIDFRVYSCSLLSETIRPVRINDFKWVTSSEFDSFEFPAADQATVDKLLEGL